VRFADEGDALEEGLGCRGGRGRFVDVAEAVLSLGDMLVWAVCGERGSYDLLEQSRYPGRTVVAVDDAGRVTCDAGVPKSSGCEPKTHNCPALIRLNCLRQKVLGVLALVTVAPVDLQILLFAYRVLLDRQVLWDGESIQKPLLS
jgi:hypothetical protein